tara:strand:+ start:4771 stop:5019 length:249 start_codon:yes stop_codon:yes gene_type:complete
MHILSFLLAEVAGTDLDNGVVLDELARTAPDDQRAKLVGVTDIGLTHKDIHEARPHWPEQFAGGRGCEPLLTRLLLEALEGG